MQPLAAEPEVAETTAAAIMEPLTTAAAFSTAAAAANDDPEAKGGPFSEELTLEERDAAVDLGGGGDGGGGGREEEAAEREQALQDIASEVAMRPSRSRRMPRQSSRLRPLSHQTLQTWSTRARSCLAKSVALRLARSRSCLAKSAVQQDAKTELAPPAAVPSNVACSAAAIAAKALAWADAETLLFAEDTVLFPAEAEANNDGEPEDDFSNLAATESSAAALALAEAKTLVLAEPNIVEDAEMEEHNEAALRGAQWPAPRSCSPPRARSSTRKPGFWHHNSPELKTLLANALASDIAEAARKSSLVAAEALASDEADTLRLAKGEAAEDVADAAEALALIPALATDVAEEGEVAENVAEKGEVAEDVAEEGEVVEDVAEEGARSPEEAPRWRKEEYSEVKAAYMLTDTNANWLKSEKRQVCIGRMPQGEVKRRRFKVLSNI